MAVTPSGILSKPVDEFATMLANVAAFQTWVDADDASEAISSIYPHGIETGLDNRPFCAIHLDGYKSTAIGGGFGNTFSDSGAVLLVFEAAVGDDNIDSIPDAVNEFLNAVGSIIAGLKSLSGVDGYPHIRTLDRYSGPSRVDAAEANTSEDYIQMAFTATWGT